MNQGGNNCSTIWPLLFGLLNYVVASSVHDLFMLDVIRAIIQSTLHDVFIRDLSNHLNHSDPHISMI